MLNRIMMTGRITTDLNILTEEDYSYCKFSIAVSAQTYTFTRMSRQLWNSRFSDLALKYISTSP